jgi:GMP synthase (glutamine-hydrolysing)
MHKILLVNNAEPGITEFTKPIEKIVASVGFTSIIIEYGECVKFNFNNFDGAILSGSPQGDDIVEHHLPYFQWIKEFDRPVLGICAGHHIAGFMYGSEILRSIESETGDFEVEILKEDILFKGIANFFNVKQMHNDSITLPKDFELLATSKICKNQLMKHKQKPLYTCQFHPEFYNHKLIENFVSICKST